MSAATVVAAPLPLPPEQPGSGAVVRAELTREYAGGGDGLWNSAFLRTLPRHIDDVTADFGDDLYDRMLLDARIAAEIDNLRAAVLEDGVVLAPAVADAAQDGYALAVAIADAATAMLADLDPALDDALWDLAGAVALGNRVAEQVYDYGYVGPSSGVVKLGLLLTRLAPKPRRNYAFVVDPFNRLIGLLARIPGEAGYGTTGPGAVLVAADAPPPNLLPRAKFAVYTHRGSDGDPRGTSILRPAYTPWVLKQQMLAEHVKYLTQFASPSLIGILSKLARDKRLTDGAGNFTGEVIAAADALLTELLAFRNGTALVVPPETEVKELYSTGDGAAFLRAFEMYNRDITLAITGQSLATTEGEHQARAAASVHQDILATRVKQLKLGLARMLRRDVLRRWVALNWGDAAAATLTPLVSLGSVEEEDVTPRMTAVAALDRAGYLAPSQRPGIDVMLGLPERTPEETARETERASQPPPPAAPPASDPSAPAGQGDANV